jgi:hypothetical protein
MLSPIGTTGHLVRAHNRQPALELALIFLNLVAYTFALANFLSTLT